MIDVEKLKFFASKVSIWDYFSMAESRWKSLSIEEQTSLLNKCYSELDDRYIFFIGAVNSFIDNSFSVAIKTSGCISLTRKIALPEKT